MDQFIDVSISQLNKHGEELCGDQARVHKDERYTRIVLSDGLGSGVKANILATMTAEIVISMLREGAELSSVIETVMGTLPICQERKIAYATFSILELDHHTLAFKIINYDNPPPFYLKQGVIQSLPERREMIRDKEIVIYEGTVERGDFLGLISDGVWYAGMGTKYNFGWGWENIAAFLAGQFEKPINLVETITDRVVRRTNELYGGQPGDDATLVGVYVRKRHKAMVFTGPPVDRAMDAMIADRLQSFEGRRIICGGTSSNIVARAIGKEVHTALETSRDDVPPVGNLEGIDLVTEGILTLNQTIRIIQEVDGDYSMLENDRNGAVLLALELLVADDITFIVGQTINAYYQNPLLPMSVSIRKNLIQQLIDLLRGFGKEITLEEY
ncbi:MAG: SpoIIE family protein phosphatase [Anaerolineaceae bacterium]|nr:SpoIIE family protein phosphatase [Anaerolineaceae bacterium]